MRSSCPSDPDSHSEKNLKPVQQKPVSEKLFLSFRKYDPGSSYRIRILIFTLPGSWIQGSKRHRIPDPDPQHCN